MNSRILAHLRGRLRRRAEGGAGSGVLRPRLVTKAPGGSGPRPPGTTTWLRGGRCTDPEEMPEMEARPPTENRHGGAPRGERVPPDARRASGSADRRARQRDNRKTAPFGAPLAPHGGEWKGDKQNPGAATRRGNGGGCVMWKGSDRSPDGALSAF